MNTNYNILMLVLYLHHTSPWSNVLMKSFLACLSRFRSFLARYRSFEVVSWSLYVFSCRFQVVSGHFRLFPILVTIQDKNNQFDTIFVLHLQQCIVVLFPQCKIPSTLHRIINPVLYIARCIISSTLYYIINLHFIVNKILPFREKIG